MSRLPRHITTLAPFTALRHLDLLGAEHLPHAKVCSVWCLVLLCLSKLTFSHVRASSPNARGGIAVAHVPMPSAHSRSEMTRWRPKVHPVAVVTDAETQFRR